MHLCYGYSMEKHEWDAIFKSKTASIFTKKLLRHIYTPAEIVQRSVSGDEKWKTPNGKNSRKQITPQKDKIIKSKFFLLNNYTRVSYILVR